MIYAYISLAVILLQLAIIDVVRRKRACPDVPLITCIINTLLAIPHALKFGPFGVEPSMPRMIPLALAKARGKTDLGDKQRKFVERYETARLIAFQKAKFRYTPCGHLAIQTSLKTRLDVQLRFFDYLSKHKEIEQQKMKDPIFIIGFPRTGTTFLHELLGIHPGVRMHYTWEQFDPVPHTEETSIEAQEADRQSRYYGNRSAFNTFLALSGDRIQSIHRIGYDDSEECTTPCAMDLPWVIATIPFITYAAKEVADLGGGQVFKNYRKYLKLLQWQSQDRRDADFTWMLKCPFHLPYLSELFEEFPNATIVWTHRDPVDCIASACSLYETILLFTMEPDSIDKAQLGKAVLDYTRVCLDKAFESIKRAGPNLKILHIRYADNVKNPKEMCKSVFEKTGLPFSAEYEARLDAYLAKNAAERAALKAKKESGQGDASATIHSYSLEEYGLSKELIQETFGDYIKLYNLAEPAAKGKK